MAPPRRSAAAAAAVGIGAGHLAQDRGAAGAADAAGAGAAGAACCSPSAPAASSAAPSALRARRRPPPAGRASLLLAAALAAAPALLLTCTEAAAGGAEEEGAEGTCDAASGSCGDAAASAAWEPKTLSVVLPCASEGEFAVKTAQAVSDSVPGGGGGGALAEIVIVDDGSSPSVSSSFPKELREKLGVRIVRHKKAKGLIQAKSAGANNATGDVIVFFDCHVAPQPGWHSEFLRAMKSNYKRIVVPSITDLDIDTWKQTRRTAAVSSCYLTWDADFKWYQSAEKYIPILSGGLLGISRRWWQESGGYDDQMQIWGGENIDQSLRTWLCGGEIFAVPEAQVAHMWRKNDDDRTTAKYAVNPIHTMKNRIRVAMGWFGDFSAKLQQYEHFRWIGLDKVNVSNFKEVRKRLTCRPFAWFLWRFRDIYEEGGLVPEFTFHLRHKKSGLCLTYMGPTGTHPHGRDNATLMECGGKVPMNQFQSKPTDPQRWHVANVDRSTGKCCAGLRVWNTDQCLHSVGLPGLTTICDVTGRPDQYLRLTDARDADLAPGQLANVASRRCLTTKSKKDSSLSFEPCMEAGSKKKSNFIWQMVEKEEPLETKLYKQAKLDSPELFL